MKKKRKTIQAVASAKRRLAARNSPRKISPEIKHAIMQAHSGGNYDDPQDNEPGTIELNWQEERFVEAFVLNGGNAAGAMRETGATAGSASVLGNRMLLKVKVLAAIEQEKADLRRRLNFTRDQALGILVGMATAGNDDFAKVLVDPSDRKNYVGLGAKRYAIESAKQTEFTTEDGSTRVTNEIKIITPGERRNIINDLWDKLGLDKDASQSDRVSFLERFASIGSRLGRSKSTGGPTSGQGS
jgi:phage terminase small subunit